MSKINVLSIVHNFENAAEHEIEHLMNWMQNKTPKVVNAFLVAHNITQAFVNAAKSPGGVTAETILSEVAPQTAAWYPVIIPFAQKLADIFTKIAADIPAVEGVCLRYGAEMVAAIDGNKKTIDEYITDFQNMYTPVAKAA